MKKYILVVMVLFLFNLNVNAYTKDDILNLVNNQTICDGTSSIIFKNYKTTYTRLIKQKDLTETEINAIMYNLNNAISLLNNNNVCKLSDINKLTNDEKRTILNSLINGSNIISKAENIIIDKEEVIGDSGIVIDKNAKEVIIYDKGILIDKVIVDTPKLTYTGPSIYILLFILLLIISIIGYILVNKKRIIIKDLLLSLIYVLSILLFINILFRNELIELNNYLSLFKNTNINNNKRDIIVDKKEILRYPSYGDNYATLLIPNIGISNEISFGDSQELLNKYIGHNTSTNLPGEGGIIVYSGHNSSNYLGNLKGIKHKDIIVIETSYGTFKYEVTDINIINDTDYNKVFIESDKETLILYTCYPFSNILYGSQRYVIYATLVSDNWIEGDNND